MKIKELAQSVIKDFELNYPLDIYSFCDVLNINIYREDIDMDGCLICKNGKAAIIVNSNKFSREKFSIAHELGHFFIPHHQELMFSCYDVGNSSIITKIENEKEADEFASELLMPEHLIKNYAEEVSLSKIKDAANSFETSLQSTAIRLIKLTDENAILVYWSKDKIKWHIWSDSGFMQLNTSYNFNYLNKNTKINSRSIITNDDEIDFLDIEICQLNKEDKLILIKEHYD